MATVGGNQDGSVGKIFSGNHGLKPGFSESPDVICLFVNWCHRDTHPEYPEGMRCRAKMLLWKDVSRKSLWLNLVICHWFQNMLGPFQGQSIGCVAWLGPGKSWGTWIWPIPRKLAWLEWQFLASFSRMHVCIISFMSFGQVEWISAESCWETPKETVFPTWALARCWSLKNPSAFRRS